MTVAPVPGRPTDTIVFTDLVGFTEYTDACGDAAALAVLDEQSAMARAAVAAVDGRLVKELGDGLLLWFAHPLAAIRGACAVLQSIEHARNQRDFPLGVRIGVHCGHVTPRGDDVVGHTVNVAARVTDLAGPAEVVATQEVVDVVGRRSELGDFEALGPTRVKGVTDPIWLHRLAPSGWAPSR
jgi:adenylate cyclase